LEKTRDIFVIGCRTGLRVSDYNKCIGDAVESTGLICIDETEKTGEPVYIPIHWQVKKILAKYKGVPPVISDQKLNEYLKDIGKKAGINYKVKDTRIGRNKPAESGEYCQKYELMTTHTARRSCATNLYLAGFDLYFIQGILGHRNIETTIKYLGVTRKLVSLRLVNNPYFVGE
jgi:integrase